jgi:hypothetical protein
MKNFVNIFGSQVAKEDISAITIEKPVLAQFFNYRYISIMTSENKCVKSNLVHKDNAEHLVSFLKNKIFRESEPIGDIWFSGKSIKNSDIVDIYMVVEESLTFKIAMGLTILFFIGWMTILVNAILFILDENLRHWNGFTIELLSFLGCILATACWAWFAQKNEAVVYVSTFDGSHIKYKSLPMNFHKGFDQVEKLRIKAGIPDKKA